jgi:hypothetical protein
MDDTSKSGQVYSWLGDQGGQFADEIQRIEDDVGRAMPTAFASAKAFAALMGWAPLMGQAFTVRRFELVADIA